MPLYNSDSWSNKSNQKAHQYTVLPVIWTISISMFWRWYYFGISIYAFNTYLFEMSVGYLLSRQIKLWNDLTQGELHLSVLRPNVTKLFSNGLPKSRLTSFYVTEESAGRESAFIFYRSSAELRPAICSNRNLSALAFMSLADAVYFSANMKIGFMAGGVSGPSCEHRGA